MFNRKVYIYNEIFKFFGEDETIITDWVKGFFKLYELLLNDFENNELLIFDKLYHCINEIDSFLIDNKFNEIEEKRIIVIYDNDDIIEIDDEILGFIGLNESVNSLTKMPEFSRFVNVLMFLVMKKIMEKFGAKNYYDFEKKWRDYVYSLLELNCELKAAWSSNFRYYNFIPRLYFLLFS